MALLRNLRITPLPRNAAGSGPVYQPARGGHYPAEHRCCGRAMTEVRPDVWHCQKCKGSDQS